MLFLSFKIFSCVHFSSETNASNLQRLPKNTEIRFRRETVCAWRVDVHCLLSYLIFYYTPVFRKPNLVYLFGVNRLVCEKLERVVRVDVSHVYMRAARATHFIIIFYQVLLIYALKYLTHLHHICLKIWIWSHLLKSFPVLRI